MFRLYVLVAFLLAGLYAVPAAAQEGASVSREVSVRSNDITLAGTLVVPAGEGPHPAIVFLHGSGPMTRAGFASLAEMYADLGFASLSYDKRGTGKSGGDFETHSLEDLADDAAAAIAYLEATEGIDRSRVGFWGISQAGWVASRSMGRGGDADFIVMISGGGAGSLASEMHSWDAEFEKRGLKGKELADARWTAAAYYKYFGGKISRETLLTILEDTKGTALEELGTFFLGRLGPASLREPGAWVHDYDPLPDIAKIKGPVLLLVGDLDHDHPSALAAENWRKGLANGGNTDLSVILFPGAGHGIRMRDGYEGEGRAPFADGYREVILGWLWYHILQQRSD